MIPTIFPADETVFTGYGLGPLRHAESCTVTEQLAIDGYGGAYTLELSYPANAPMAAQLEVGNIICAIPSPYRDPQPFRIYRKALESDGHMWIYANHISYDLTYTPVAPFSGDGVAATLQALNASIPPALRRFSFLTDSGTSSTFSFSSVSNVRAAIGEANGVASSYGLDILWDGWTVQLLTHRGNATPTPLHWQSPVISYGIDLDSTYAMDGVYPYWANAAAESGPIAVFGNVIYVGTPNGHDKVQPLDFSGVFSAAPSQTELQSAAQEWLDSHSIDAPRQTISTEIAQPNPLVVSVPRLDVGDEVSLMGYPGGYLGPSQRRVTSVTTDALAECYTAIEIGDEAPDVAYTVASINEDDTQYIVRG